MNYEEGESITKLLLESFKERLKMILPERADERNMNKVCEVEYLDTCDKVHGWNYCLDEIKRRAGI